MKTRPLLGAFCSRLKPPSCLNDSDVHVPLHKRFVFLVFGRATKLKLFTAYFKRINERLKNKVGNESIRVLSTASLLVNLLGASAAQSS